MWITLGEKKNELSLTKSPWISQRNDVRLLDFPEARGFPAGSVVENPPVSAGDTGDVGSVPGWGRSPGEGNGNPLQHSCLENPIDGGAWWATVCGVANSWTWLSVHSLGG